MLWSLVNDKEFSFLFERCLRGFLLFLLVLFYILDFIWVVFGFCLLCDLGLCDFGLLDGNKFYVKLKVGL